MTRRIHKVHEDADLLDVARIMRDQRIGDVLVIRRDGTLRGILTDRDLVVRAFAEDRDLRSFRAGDICSEDVWFLTPNANLDEAVRIMREHAVRRIPVLDEGMPVGIVSLGDLARYKDPNSALADISAAPANN